MSAIRQLALPFPDRSDYSAADFIRAPSNADALAWLRRTADWPDGRLVLWGEEGCGKSHLLTIWAAEAPAPVMQAPTLRGVPDLPSADRIAIDDADATGDEAALLHLLNAAHENQIPVLMAARSPPSRWRLRLPDLASRVRAAAAVRILPAEEELLRLLLARLLAGRQIAVARSVQDWLLLRLPRTPAAIREAAARLDRAALAGHTAVTRGLAARVLDHFDAGFPLNDDDSLPADRLADPSAGRSADSSADRALL
jgi:chromosomal replication initiation ATPase DnaA